MSTNYHSPGEVVTLTAPAGGVVSGQGYQIGQLFVVAAASADAAASFEGHTCGVFTLPKGAHGWEEGELVFWDSASEECTVQSAGDLLLIGCAVAVATSAATTGLVRLNGTAQPDEPAS